jgi:hypothetical protein
MLYQQAINSCSTGDVQQLKDSYGLKKNVIATAAGGVENRKARSGQT